MTSSDAGTPVEGSANLPPRLSAAKREQKMGEAVFGPGYEGPATAEAKAEDPYALTTWGEYDREFVCPSGQKCRVKKLDFKDVMTAGIADQINTLQGVADKNVRKGEGKPPVDPMKLLKDKRTSSQFSDLLDRVVSLVVTIPKVEIPPKEMKDRKAGVVYADTIHFTDKLAIFNEALGDLKGLANFRLGSGEVPERMEDESGDA